MPGRKGFATGYSTLPAGSPSMAAKPDYVALGPIYETKLKQMKWDPQGLERLADWKRRIACPLCAIGGITIERAPGVWAAGADTIAVVTDFLTHHNPDERVRAWLAWANTVRKQSWGGRIRFLMHARVAV